MSAELDPIDWLPLSAVWRIESRLRRRAVEALLGQPAVACHLARQRPGAETRTAAMLTLADLLREGDLAQCTPRQARERMIRSIAAVEAPAPGDLAVRDLRIAGLRARIYAPRDLARPAPALLFLHGGGFVTGSIETHEGLCRRYARALDAAVVSLDYRLAPEHRFPTAVEDAWSAWQWLLEEADALGLDRCRLAIGGDSAGGNLSAVICRRAAERGVAAPCVQLLLYPALDFSCASESHRRLAEGWYLTAGSIRWYLRHYAPHVDPTEPDLSPGLHAVPAGLSPAIVVTAGKDPLVDEGIAYAEALKAAGIAVDHIHHPALIHGFAMMGHAVPAALNALGESTAALRRWLHPR